MERSSDDTQQPSMCRMGCGFYGSSSSDGMCSKCFKDALRRKQSSPTTSAATIVSSPSTGLSEEPCTSHLLPSEDITAAEVSPSSSTSSVSEENDSLRQPEAQAEASTSEEDKDKDKGKSKRNRCFMCRKKVGLTGFECRCGNVYCGLHRYSDKHDCSFDYKADGRAKISKDNPVIVGSKIQKI